MRMRSTSTIQPRHRRGTAKRGANEGKTPALGDAQARALLGAPAGDTITLLSAKASSRASDQGTAGTSGPGAWTQGFDCYRPLSIQKQLWAFLPDERYVIDPRKGPRHNRGAAVDVTLVDAKGNELEMPTAYDNFSERAHRDYRLLPPSTLRNRELLERIMTRHGFQGLATEWVAFRRRGLGALSSP
jgi:hypothetical protein